MTDWRKLYTAAVLETNSSRLMELIAEAESAMEGRLHELILPDGDRERQEIAKAATALAVLKVEQELWNEEQPHMKN